MKKSFFLLAAACAFGLYAGAVTFNVQVPKGTKHVYVCGDFNGWKETEAPQLSPAGENLFTLDLPDVTDVSGGYKYLCGRDWLYVEKDASGGEIDDRKVLGNPDVVESWRTWPEDNIESVEIAVNGTKRLIKIYLPESYDSSSDSYPAIYYNTVQQRYNNAGADGDAGDYFFGAQSWYAQGTMEKLAKEGNPEYIMVQVCSFLSENTPASNPDYIGTGDAASYLNSFVTDLMGYVEGNWRVKPGAENTTIVGADYGALFSLYAALTRPDVFGKCVAMSPMHWINEGVLEEMASSHDKSQVYYISAGSREPAWMQTQSKALADALSTAGATAHYTLFEGASHDDDSWGDSFPAVLLAMTTGSAPVTGNGDDGDDSDFASKIYTLYSSSNLDYLPTNYKGTFSYTTEYCRKGYDAPVAALVCTQEIGNSYKSNYYWRIGIGENGTDEWLNDVQTIGFSGARTQPAWQNVVIFEDGTIQNIAAVNNGFIVRTSSGDTKMSKGENYFSSATVSFPSADKTFEIRFGSVNSGSIQSALTSNLSVSENCTKALITYDFNLNKVTVEELEGGSTGDEPATSEPDFADRTYTLYGGSDASNLEPVATLTYTADFRRKGSDTPVAAFVFTNDIAGPYSTAYKYYWNIAKGSSGWLLSSPKDISFSDKRTEASWHSIAVLENESTDDIAAHSKGFRVVNGSSNTVIMTQASDHRSTATVSFPTSDKSFTINYGSVNSSSDMGAMTPSLKVTDNCLEAVITYDFNLNKVTVNETKFGELSSQPAVTSISAVPAVCVAGSTVAVNIELNKASNISVACKKDFSTDVALSLSKTGDKTFRAELADAPEGLYTLSVTIYDGSSTISKAAEINVRVLSASTKFTNKKLTVNAYADVNWETTGRYKGNFHTHTSQSFDTGYTTSEVVDKYKDAGYQILALTDHDASSFPWSMFDLYNPNAEARYPEQMGILAIPGNELSKDRRNNWSESTGGEFNHHNDLFTGRKGQEFMSLRESYAYTEALGGLQIINHPGQYWNLSTTYKSGEKNSPEWHAQNFRSYSSLIGLEVYNQGNRRADDRILWDQILSITMPERPVWGYSCDDTHTAEQYFRNYQFMLMPSLDVDALKEAMKKGSTVFSYEYTGSGEAKAPRIKSISLDEENNLLTIDTDNADKIEWIYSTHRTGSSASSTRSTVIGTGNTFDFTGYQGSYVRALLTNAYGETATQPFGFTDDTTSSSDVEQDIKKGGLTVTNDVKACEVTVSCPEGISRITVINAAGTTVKYLEYSDDTTVVFSSEDLAPGVYVIVVATPSSAYTSKFIR